ncbi:MAG TPA: alkaline phosphatase family protein, partial [Pseudonocardiaceae bacterium]
MSPINRRTLLGSAAALGAGAALGLPGPIAQAMTAAPRAGTLDSVKHVVIFMQENRSFDHYFGALQGVRGFGDTSLLRFPNGSNVWRQTTKGSGSGGNVLMPFHLDTKTT